MFISLLLLTLILLKLGWLISIYYNDNAVILLSTYYLLVACNDVVQVPKLLIKLFFKSIDPEQLILLSNRVDGSYGIMLLIAVLTDVSTYYLFALSVFAVHVLKLVILWLFKLRSLVMVPNAYYGAHYPELYNIY